MYSPRKNFAKLRKKSEKKETNQLKVKASRQKIGFLYRQTRKTRKTRETRITRITRITRETRTTRTTRITIETIKTAHRKAVNLTENNAKMTFTT